MIVTFVPVLIFKNSRCLILKASPAHTELKGCLPTPPPARLNHTGRESLAQPAHVSLQWFLSLLLKGTPGEGVVRWVGSQEIWFFFLVPCDWRKFCLLLLIQKIFSKVTFSLFYIAVWLLLVEVTLLGCQTSSLWYNLIKWNYARW